MKRNDKTSKKLKVRTRCEDDDQCPDGFVCNENNICERIRQLPRIRQLSAEKSIGKRRRPYHNYPQGTGLRLVLDDVGLEELKKDEELQQKEEERQQKEEERLQKEEERQQILIIAKEMENEFVKLMEKESVDLGMVMKHNPETYSSSKLDGLKLLLEKFKVSYSGFKSEDTVYHVKLAKAEIDKFIEFIDGCNQALEGHRVCRTPYERLWDYLTGFNNNVQHPKLLLKAIFYSVAKTYFTGVSTFSGGSKKHKKKRKNNKKTKRRKPRSKIRSKKSKTKRIRKIR